MNAEDFVVVHRRDDLRHALRSFHGAGTAARGEGKRPDLVLAPARLDLLLGLADPGDLRGRVNHGGNHAVVHLAVKAGDQVGDHHAFLLALVREHRAAYHVADGPDRGHPRAAVIVDLDEAARIDGNRRRIAEKAVGEGAAADGNDELVDLQGLLALRVGIRHVHHPVLDAGARHLGAELDVEALFLEVALCLLGDGLVDHGQELVECLEHRDLAAEAAPDAAEFEPDDAGPDHTETPRHCVELQRIPRIDDVFPIVRHVLQADRHGTRGDYHMGRLQGALRAVGGSHDDLSGPDEPAVSLDANHAVGLEKGVDAVGHGLDHRCAAFLHGAKIQTDIPGADAVNRELVLGALEQLRGFEQGLGGDAAGIEAGAAEGVGAVEILPFVDASNLQLVLRGADGRRVTGGSAADHDDVELLAHTPMTRRAGSSRLCFTVTRNCTASRPSMMRWS